MDQFLLVVTLEETLEGPGEIIYDDLDDLFLGDDLAFEMGVDIQTAHDVLNLVREGDTLKLISSRTEN